MYEIMYDYCDERGNVVLDIREEFEGTWDELQSCLEQMREVGCYHIDVADLRD